MEKIHVWVNNAEESVKAQELLHLLGYTPIRQGETRALFINRHYIRGSEDGELWCGEYMMYLNSYGHGSKEVTLDELEATVKEKHVNKDTPFEELCTAVGRINKEAEQYLRTDAMKLASFHPHGNLRAVMPWDKTPQGFKYWEAIYDTLQESKTKEVVSKETSNIVAIEDITSPAQEIEVVINGVKSVVCVGDLIVAWGLLGKANGDYGCDMYNAVDIVLSGGQGLTKGWNFNSIEFSEPQKELVDLYFTHKNETKEQLEVKKTIQDLESQLEVWKSKLK